MSTPHHQPTVFHGSRQFIPFANIIRIHRQAPRPGSEEGKEPGFSVFLLDPGDKREVICMDFEEGQRLVNEWTAYRNHIESRSTDNDVTMEALLARVLDERDELAKELAEVCIGQPMRIPEPDPVDGTALDHRHALYRSLANLKGLVQPDVLDDLMRRVDNYVGAIQKNVSNLVNDRDNALGRNRELLDKIAAIEANREEMISAIATC